MGSLKILIAEPLDFSKAAADVLRCAGELHFSDQRVDLSQAFRDFDVIWLRLAYQVEDDVIGPNSRCRVLATPVTGLDHIDLDACRRHGVRVVSLRGEVDFLKEVKATAELTIALTLALLRLLTPAAGSVLNGQWDRDRFRGRELYGKTAGIVGMGRLGTIVAGYFRAFGMKVIGYDIRDDFPHEHAESVSTLDQLMQCSDVISIHVPFDDSTRKLIGEQQLASLRPGAVLINTARGGILDEVALLSSLQSGRLAGAAIDVLDGEPHIQSDHPLVRYASTHENLLITPHIGGNTVESFAKTELFLANRVVDLLKVE